ncbi:RagB/SusD family nutrient uptake outer membrane protein [Pedobacter hiemivivus]|uniref:RagB/SusD family nutrient uptake outer membrane protein n=1 Tax=Pedobacter hiemivivus TaxID=2530454 RepID=A0A4R0MNE1_9SPHI|nr:RagB/SusD family nutrient uptake outer membrane protein [Pedobacter hiemivivus]TCC88309.1 RagB/SusD family nutrient uptake outer membrane protein [Pedobacter hiemivivus]
MKQYNNLYKTAALGIGLALSIGILPSCNKGFLDVPEQGKQQSTIFWKTADDATAGVNAIYGNLRSWENTAFPAIAIESTGSDDADKGSTASDASFFLQFDQFTIDPDQGNISGFWNGQYRNINYTNQVLDNIPGITMDENLKARYLAEAKFVRAFSYFRLVRAFGGVPLRLHVPKDANTDYNLPRASVAEVYAQIEKDLNEAAVVLPASYTATTDIGRATKGAALTLHAKVAMYLKKWTDVMTYTNTVMGMGYSLLPNYEKVFRIENENSVESIFEIQCGLLPNNKDASNSQYSQVQGVRGITGGGWGFNVPSANLAAAYETGDPRRDATIIFRGETTPSGDFIPATGDNPMYNQKSYVPFSLFVPNFNEGAQQNVRMLRYSDVLLMNAEAANELNNSGQAISSLEQVRLRAREGNTAILPKVTTTDQVELRKAIYRERRVEFAMEFDRYFDVIRQGRGTEVFGPKGWKAGRNEVWPIPQTEIDLSGGVLTQNPGF